MTEPNDLISRSEVEKMIEKIITLYRLSPDQYTDAGEILRIIKKELSQIESVNGGETLEEIIEDIGKRMCHAGLLYPNAGYWTLQDRWGWECKRETLIEVYKEFREELKRDGHYD